MNMRGLLIAILALGLGVAGLVYVDRSLAQSAAQAPMMGPMAQMMGPGGQMMGSGQMMGQMQQQIDRMNTTLKAMRARLDRINPAMLTPAEREMLEYLKLLQTHMESMQGWMGGSMGVMRQMPGMRR